MSVLFVYFMCNLHARERMRWSALSRKMNCVHVHVLSTADKYLREFRERTPPTFSCNYESLNFFSQYYIVLEVVHPLLSFTHFLSPSSHISLVLAVYYYYLLLFSREEFSFVYFWAVLLFLLLSSFFFIVNTSIHIFSLFRSFFQSLIKILIHTVELSRLASISFCHLSVVNIIPKVTSWKPISLTLNCSS